MCEKPEKAGQLQIPVPVIERVERYAASRTNRRCVIRKEREEISSGELNGEFARSNGSQDLVNASNFFQGPDDFLFYF